MENRNVMKTRVVHFVSRGIALVFCLVFACPVRAAPFKIEAKPGDSLVVVRDCVRSLTENERRRGVEVILAPGEYFLPNGLSLAAADGGVSNAPSVTWRARKPGTVRIVGARPIPSRAFSRVTDPALLARLPESARGKVYFADVSELFPDAVPPFSVRACGGSNGYQPMPPLVFTGGRHGKLAGWPNAGRWCVFSNRVDRGTLVSGKLFKGGAFVFSDPRLKRWNFGNGVWLEGYFTHDWASWAAPAVSWGVENGMNDVVRIDPKASVYYGVMSGTWGRKERRFRAFNLFEELDAEGEWWLDRERKRLYIVPFGGRMNDETDVRMVTSSATLLEGRGVRNLRFEGIEFAYAYGTLADMRDCESVEFSGCRFRNSASNGILIYGRNCRVCRCEVANCGLSGVVISGGDRLTLMPSGNVVEDCRIHGFGILQRTYAPGVSILNASVGVVVRGNEIFDAPHSAVIYGGNDHLFESNEVHHVLMETGDAGAFYTGRDWTTQGNVLRCNFIHDIGAGTTDRESQDAAVSGTNVMGVYFDDCDCGDEVYGNVFCNVGRGILIGGGRDHPVRSNVFINCNLGLSIDFRGITWKNWNTPGWNLEERAQRLGYTNGVWSTRYPRLANIMNDHPREPLYNPVEGNVFVDCGEILEIGTMFQLDENGMAPGLVSRMAPIRGNTVIYTKDAGIVKRKKPDPRIASGFRVIDCHGKRSAPE